LELQTVATRTGILFLFRPIKFVVQKFVIAERKIIIFDIASGYAGGFFMRKQF